MKKMIFALLFFLFLMSGCSSNQTESGEGKKNKPTVEIVDSNGQPVKQEDKEDLEILHSIDDISGEWVNCNDGDQHFTITKKGTVLVLNADNSDYVLEMKENHLYSNVTGSITLTYDNRQEIEKAEKAKKYNWEDRSDLTKKRWSLNYGVDDGTGRGGLIQMCRPSEVS